MIAGIKGLGAHLQALAPRQRDPLCPLKARYVARRTRLTGRNLTAVSRPATQLAAVGLFERARWEAAVQRELALWVWATGLCVVTIEKGVGMAKRTITELNDEADLADQRQDLLHIATQSQEDAAASRIGRSDAKRILRLARALAALCMLRRAEN